MSIMSMFVIKSSIAAVIGLAAAMFDVRIGKIPNKLTFPAILLGLLLTVFTESFSALAVLLGIIFGLFLVGMTGVIGLGDIKLLMAITAISGYKFAGISFAVGTLYLCIFAAVTNPIETYIYLRKSIRRLLLKHEKINKSGTKYKFATFLFMGIITYFLFLDAQSPFHATFVNFATSP